MSETAIKATNRRYPWLAVMLSLIMPGLGQVYCGKLARGLILNFLNILPLPVIIGLFSISNSPALMYITMVMIFAGGMVQLVAIIDSAYLAKHTRSDYELKECNRWYVYVLLVFIVTGGSIGSALYLRDQVLEAFIVPTASCYPTIVPGDRIFANKGAYKTGDPKRGDIVVLTCPEDRRWSWIKRIVAVAGDTVEMKGNELYINGQKLERKSVERSMRHGTKMGEIFLEKNDDTEYKIILTQMENNAQPESADFAKTTIPAHHCFVLGDNRNNSRDSRQVGPIPLATIKGRADYLYFPAKDWSRFGKLD